jgi:hypothetical protein
MAMAAKIKIRVDVALMLTRFSTPIPVVGHR